MRVRLRLPDNPLNATVRVFAEEGVNAPVKEIAARAGVGVGTVYRRLLCEPATKGDVGQTRRMVALLLNGMMV
jgi:hypothetical protein